jgi:hypothetical protein
MTNTTTPTWLTTDADVALAAYRAADIGGKNRMRTAFRDAIGAAVVRAASGDVAALADAAAYVAIVESFGPADRPAVVVDYAARIADRRASLVAALAAIDAGTVIMPDGVDAPTVPADGWPTDGTVDAAFVRSATTIGGRKNGRGDVPAYVARVMAACDAPTDGWTATRLHAAWTADIGGDDYPASGPSVGAIGAAFVRVIDGADGTDDYGWTVETNAAGTRVAVAG